jgi:N-glycosylase/DNA lyase
MRRYPGLRLIRQDPWECLMSYVCSSASNIPKIQKNIELMSQCFGKKQRYQDHIFYTFPEIGDIHCKKTLKTCSVGYRDRYLHEINNIVDRNFFTRLRKRSYHDAKDVLMELPGVGPKVADCVCLFSLDHLDAFPVDVWVKRIMTELYGKEMRKSYAAINEKNIMLFARDHFGDYAGYAQQYLFHLRRSDKK